MSWTDEKVEELKRLWSEGITTGEIGRRLNMSKNSVVGKVHRLGLSGRPSPIKKKDEENDDLSTGMPKEKTKPVKKTINHKEKSSATVKNEVKAPAVKETKEKSPSQPKPSAPQTAKPVQEKKPLEIINETEEADIKLVQSLEPAPKETSPKGFVGLTDLDNHTCRWPIGDPKDENFHFCGKKVRSGQTYCEEHAVIAYVKPIKK